MTQENAEKLCNIKCNDIGVCYIGLSNDGINDICAWKTGEENFGYSVVSYTNNEAYFIESYRVISFTQMMSDILDRISKKAREVVQSA